MSHTRLNSREIYFWAVVLYRCTKGALYSVQGWCWLYKYLYRTAYNSALKTSLIILFSQALLFLFNTIPPLHQWPPKVKEHSQVRESNDSNKRLMRLKQLETEQALMFAKIWNLKGPLIQVGFALRNFNKCWRIVN